jgi:ACT domain-containing protein
MKPNFMATTTKKGKDLAIITVIGKDRTGIVANVSTALYEENINIEDIMQTIMDDIFVMAMLVDIGKSKKDIKAIRQRLEKVGVKIGMQIQIQHEKIFETMHRL